MHETVRFNNISLNTLPGCQVIGQLKNIGL